MPPAPTAHTESRQTITGICRGFYLVQEMSKAHPFAYYPLHYTTTG